MANQARPNSDRSYQMTGSDPFWTRSCPILKVDRFDQKTLSSKDLYRRTNIPIGVHLNWVTPNQSHKPTTGTLL